MFLSAYNKLKKKTYELIRSIKLLFNNNASLRHPGSLINTCSIN